MENIEVFPGVVIFGIALSGPEITVDIYGGGDNLMVGTVVYEIHDPCTRRSVLNILRKWRKTQESVVYVGDENGGVLMDTDVFEQISEA